MSKVTTTLGRSFQRDYGERTSKRERESGILSLSLSRSFLPSFSPSHARARDRAGRGVESRRERGHLFPCLSLSLFHLAARVHDYDAPVPLTIPREGAPWTRTRGRLARSTLLFSCADRTRRWARSRAAPRDHGRYAVDPRAAAAARNRVNASPVVLLVHLGRRPGRRETAGLSSSSLASWIGSSTIRRGFGGAASRARSSRANVQRSLVRARQVRRRASSLWLLKRPSARRGPGIVSVDRNVRSKCRCSCVLQFTS